MHSKNQRRHSSPSSSRAPLVPMKTKMSLRQSEVEPLPFRVPRDYPHSRFNKAPLAVYPPKGARTKACVSMPVVSLEKIHCFSRSEGAEVKINSTSSAVGSSLSAPSSSSLSSSSSSSSFSLKSPLTLAASHKNQDKLTNGRSLVTPRSITPPVSVSRRPSPSHSPLDKRPTPSPSSQDSRPSPSSLDRRACIPPSPPEKKHPTSTKGSRHKRVSGRIFDPNKHCGVLDPESKRPCTRSLTCKTHSLTHRRAVPGRRKDFDILLAEHKGRAKEKEAGQKKEALSSQSAHPAQSLESLCCVPKSCPNGKTTPTLKLRLANPHIQRISGGGGAVVLSSTPMHVPAPDVVPSGQRYGGDAHVSSDEGEAELAEETEKPLWHYSVYHPQPTSWCAFSSRLMGWGLYVFDRRWDRMRFALHCMVEKHINAQMWRKVPMVADSAVSLSPSPAEESPMSSSFLSPGLSPVLNNVSMVSYSTPFSHNDAGVFCIRDPDPSPKTQLSKPSRPARASGEAVQVKKRKPPHISETDACQKNGSGYHPPPGSAHISNGTAALSVRAKPRTEGQGLRDSDRYVSVELTLPQVLTGDHGVVSSHSPLPYSSTEGRKRKTSGPAVTSDRAGKVTKTKALDGIFRKSSAALLSSVAEVSQSGFSRLPKVQH